ncbi:unnamed protein product [Urochloa decumbens]|uniref:Xylanase inhibitor C-terminal domain-containing protein n=1 Tax=Urochloa decumbens TaxID=240449 RepID=A0ABC8XV78_9POAL
MGTSSLFLAALALAATLEALAPVAATMAAPPAASVAVESWYQALEKDRSSSEVASEALHAAIHLMHKFVEEFPSLLAGDGSGGTGAPPDAIRFVGTGGRLTFPLAAVDITAQLTATTSVPPYIPLGSQVYACRAVQATSGGTAAVLGLGWRGADSLGLRGFSYSVSSNGEISLHRGAASAWGNTVKLLSNPNYPDLYYVRVTGINVAVGKNPQQPVPFPAGGLDLRQDGSGGGVFLSTTMPLTLLNEGVYNSLIRTLPQTAIAQSNLSSRQLCYRSGTTQAPAITLVLDGGAMKLPVESCWYEQASDGSVCLAILPSLWPTGESVLGTMMQSGWRMTYNLAAGTLTFQPSSSSTVLHNSPCVLWVPLLLLLLSSFTTFL